MRGWIERLGRRRGGRCWAFLGRFGFCVWFSVFVLLGSVINGFQIYSKDEGRESLGESDAGGRRKQLVSSTRKSKPSLPLLLLPPRKRNNPLLHPRLIFFLSMSEIALASGSTFEYNSPGKFAELLNTSISPICLYLPVFLPSPALFSPSQRFKKNSMRKSAVWKSVRAGSPLPRRVAFSLSRSPLTSRCCD